MYSVEYTGKFKKDLKRCLKRGLDLKLLHEAITILSSTGTLPPEYRAHILSGKYDGIWECHIKGDWLMMWEQFDDELRLIMLSTGTHSDFFDK